MVQAAQENAQMSQNLLYHVSLRRILGEDVHTSGSAQAQLEVRAEPRAEPV